MKQNITERIFIIVCGTLAAGGAERIISILSAFFVEKFDKVEILTWRDAPIFYKFDERVKVISIPQQSFSKSLVGQMLWFRKYIKRTTPYCVLSFLTPFNILTIISLLRCSVPVLVCNRSDPRYDISWIWKKIRDLIYCFADGLSVQTPNHKAYFSQSIQKKTTIICNPSFLSPEMVGKALRVPKAKIIVSVGRLKRVKNQGLLIEAFADVVNHFPDYSLVIFGEGEMRSILEKKIKDLRLEGKVELPGEKLEVHSLILKAEIFVLSSDYEGMPNALIEAMCLGLPVVSTRIAGAVGLIKDHENGILVGVGDRNELANGMIELIEKKDKALKFAQKGVYLAEELKLDVITGQWMQFIDENVRRKNKKK